MRITRVSRIRGHRLFSDFVWPSNLQSFGQFNLIYGWNACGKTTLSSLFALLEKRTNLAEGEVEFEIDENRRCKGDEISATNLPLVRVFNRDVVNATIAAAGERVEPIYYVGEESIEKKARIDELKQELASALDSFTQAKAAKSTAEANLDKFCIDTAKRIKELLTGSQSTQYNNYDKRQFKQTVRKMQAPSDAQAALLSNQDKEQMRKQKEAQPKGDLASVSFDGPDFPELSSTATALLARSVASETLDELLQDKTVAGWVQQGLALHSGSHQTNTCHFCAQPFTTERRTALERHFNDAFSSFQEQISSAIVALDLEIESLKALTFVDSARAYEQLQDKLTAATAKARGVIDSSIDWLSAVREDLGAKRDSPFESTEPGSWHDRVPRLEAVLEALAAVNAVISSHNSVTSDFTRKIAEACETLERHFVAEVWGEHNGLAKAVIDADSALKPLQAEISRLSGDIEAKERDIVEHRRPAEELNRELRAYLGRSELRFDVKETGYALSRSGQPVNNLSEGERTAIAFLYFLKTLQDQSFDLANGVVVIDDPVSSLDTNALFSAFGYMKERTKACGQLFVLTHNFGFFRQVKNWFHHLPKQNSKRPERRPGRFFMLSAREEGSGRRCAAIGPLDPLLEEYESEYHYLYHRVYEEAQQEPNSASLEQYYALPNIARRLVESFLAFKYPDCEGNLSQSLDRVEFDSGKKTRILRLLNTYSHSGGIADPEHDLSVLAETRPVLSEVLDMIKAVDPAHYAGMQQLMNRESARDDRAAH